MVVVVVGLPAGRRWPVCEGFSAREHVAGTPGCSRYDNMMG